MDSLLRSASVGRERPTATPAAALPLIKLRESASKSDQKLDDSTRGVAAQRKAGRRRQGPARHAGPLARRRDGTGGESERRRHGIADSSAAVLPAHGKRPCCRHLFREYQACMGASADPLPVPSCGVAFRPERCRRITCALQQRLGMKMKAKIFRYRESYRDFGVNKNENGYRKYRNRCVMSYS